MTDDALRLEPLGPQHVAALDAFVEDPDVLRFTRVPVPAPPGFAEAWLGRYEQGRIDGTSEGFAVVDGDGAVVGLALAPEIDREASTVELGYLVAPGARGRGVATEALRQLTAWAFGTLGAERIELLISDDNVGSKRVAERCGYVREGVLRSVHLKAGVRNTVEIWSRIAADPPPSPPARAAGAPAARRTPAWWPRGSSEPRRLRRAVEERRVDLDAAVERARRDGRGNEPWVEAVRRHLAAAETAADEVEAGHGDRDRGWGALAAAARAAVHGLDRVELEQEAAMLRAEVAEKLRPWRRGAALELLDRGFPAPKASSADHPETDERLAASRTALERALKIRDEAAQNSYRDIGLLRRQLLRVGLMVLGALAAIVTVWAVSAPAMSLGDEGLVETTDLSDLLMVVAFGLLGGAVSAARPLNAADGARRIPERLADWQQAVARPLLGAAGALAAYAFLAAGLLPLDSGESTGLVLAVAFVAGFSEKLILRAVETVAGRDAR